MLAQRVTRRCHCPVVHTYHTVYEDYTQYLFFSERLGRMTAEKATRILSGYCSLMLAPTEKGADYPHNMKVYNLCRMKSNGIEAWIEESALIRKRYYEGDFVVGQGPILGEK